MINISGDLFPATRTTLKNRRLMVNAGGKNPVEMNKLTLIHQFDGNFRIDPDAGNWSSAGWRLATRGTAW